MMMRELFVELQRDEKMKSRPADFRAWLAQGETSAAALEDALRAADKTKADTAFGKITEPCASCHTVYRNVPQKADTRQP